MKVVLGLFIKSRGLKRSIEKVYRKYIYSLMEQESDEVLFEKDEKYPLIENA